MRICFHPDFYLFLQVNGFVCPTIKSIKYLNLLTVKKNLLPLFIVSLLLVLTTNVYSQRKSEKLGRGVVAINQGSGKVYVSWRLLGTDPSGTTFNVYKSTSGAEAIKLNLLPIQTTTDYIDNSANTAVTNAYFVKPVIGGVEVAPSVPFVLPSNSEVAQYQRIVAQPIDGKYDYDMKFCWVGDLNGDGEFDYVIDRLPFGQYPDSTGGRTAKIEAYSSKGTFLWRVDAGPNVEISSGHNDMVTVFDLNGDGYSEVVLKTSEGTIFGDGTRIGDLNNDGKTDYRNASGIVTGHALQYISVLDGRTGKELSRALMPHQEDISATPGKKNWELGAFSGHFGVMYMDGIHPSFLFAYTNRNNAGPYDKSFNQFITTWDFINGQLTQRTDWNDEAGSNSGNCYNHFHQIRIVDVDRDGKDEMVEGGFVLDDDGAPLWGNCDIVHGDRFQTAILDPDYPGMQTFLIQQNNPTSLGMAIIDASTGKFIKKWYQSAQGDVGRGEALDLDSNVKGLEVMSTMSGLYSGKGEYLGEHSIFPNSAIWWDGDLQREMLRAPDGAGANIMVNKPGWDGTRYTEGARLIEFARQSGWVVSASYGCRPMFEGDILGDWREEVILRENPGTGCVAFRVYSTTIPAQNKLYCLMQNPAYRQTVTGKGYYQAPYTDYYLGGGMATPPTPPIQETKLQWKGGQASNVWDIQGNTNWLQNDTSAIFSQNDDVMFDITGTGNTNITIQNTITPSSILVISPVNYTFNGTGKLSGTMSLRKSGFGMLTIKNTNDYTGPTVIEEGGLILDGILTGSPVTINWHAMLGGVGTLNQAVTFANGSILIPGTEGVAGTLTFSKDISFPGGMTLKMDISDEPAGILKKHDRIIVNGNLTLTGENTIQVNQLNGNLPAGTYPLISYTGTFTGDIKNLKISGIVGKKYVVNNASGEISVTVEDTRDPAKVVWSGAGKNWDILQTTNWLLQGQTDLFAPNDSVVFNATGSAQTDINLVAGSLPVKDMLVETATTNYKFSGAGLISGTGGITKNGIGTLALYTKNDYTGKTTINNGSLEVGYLDDAGQASAIGASTVTDPSNVVLNNAVLKYLSSANIYTNRGITLAGVADTIQTNTALITLKGVIAGTGKLVKTGNGTLVLQQQTNTFAGGVTIKAGSLVLGDDLANRYGLGKENATITLEGGTFAMFSSGTYNNSYWNLIVPNGANVNFNADNRCDLFGTLTGSGTLNMFIPYVRTTLNGDWSGFTGKIIVGYNGDRGGAGEFRINNTYGLEKSAVHLAAKIAVNTVTANRALAIGELSGIAEASLNNAAYTIGARNSDATFNGNINGNSITKVGTGVWTLTDTCFYSNPTTVNGGKISLNSLGLITGPVVVNTTGTFAGTGTVKGNVTINTGGAIEPGATLVGTLKLGGTLTLNTGSTTRIKVNKTNKTQDSIRVNGIATLGGILTIQLQSGAFSIGDSLKVISAPSYSGTFSQITPATPGVGMQWDKSTVAKDGYIRVTLSNSVNSVWTKTFSIHPNPVKEITTIEFGEVLKSVSVSIQSAGGQLISEQVFENTSFAKLNVSAYPAGTYFVILNSGQKVRSIKLIKW